MLVSKKIAEQTLAEALKTGGDFAELFVQDERSESLVLMDNRIENAVTGRRHGAGIRICKGLNSVYVHTNDTSLNGLLAAARKGADAVGSMREGCVDVNLTGSVIRNIHEYRQLPLDVSGARKAGLLKQANAAARDVSAEIQQVQVSLMSRDGEVLIANSEGLFTTDRRVYTRMGVNAIAANGMENQSSFYGPGALMGYEFYDTFDVAEKARSTAQKAVTMLHAESCPAGVMPVVIDGGFGGVIFHEACGHSLEAAAVAFGNSEFAGKLGEQIASPLVTAVDDGTMPNQWGSTNIDDEGTPTTNLTLIENGVLKNYMVDRLNGKRMGMPSTGSSRRQDYTFAPVSRMRNTYIAAGSDDEAEIIATCGDGLYAKSMGGGQVNPVTGEFNFGVSEGYLIKDGKIDRPVRGAMLIGRGGEVLKKIDRVGRKMWMEQGMCGASSGSVPTNVGQPMIRVTGLTVGGR